jgi:hypothetical protein
MLEQRRTVVVDTYAFLRNKLTHLKTGMQALSEVVSLATTPTGSLRAKTPPTQPTQETALPTATPQQPEVSAPEPVSLQSKEPSLMSKLQAPNKQATVRFTVDMSVGRAPQIVDVGSKDGTQESRSECECC